MPAALITGASRGIGAYVAERLAARGYQAVLMARSEEQLQQVAQQCRQHQVEPVIIAQDVTEYETVSRKLDETLTGLDLQAVFINHGIAQFGPFLEDTRQRWRQVIDVNLTASMHLAQTVVPHLKQAASPTRSLIFTASIAAKLHNPHAAAYCVSKHGLLAFAHCLFESVREDGIKVASLCPGFVNTALVSSDKLERDKMIQPADIWDAVDYVLRSSPHSCPVELQIRPQHSPYL